MAEGKIRALIDVYRRRRGGGCGEEGVVSISDTKEQINRNQLIAQNHQKISRTPTGIGNTIIFRSNPVLNSPPVLGCANHSQVDSSGPPGLNSSSRKVMQRQMASILELQVKWNRDRESVLKRTDKYTGTWGTSTHAFPDDDYEQRRNEAKSKFKQASIFNREVSQRKEEQKQEEKAKDLIESKQVIKTINHEVQQEEELQKMKKKYKQALLKEEFLKDAKKRFSQEVARKNSQKELGKRLKEVFKDEMSQSQGDPRHPSPISSNMSHHRSSMLPPVLQVPADIKLNLLSFQLSPGVISHANRLNRIQNRMNSISDVMTTQNLLGKS